VTGWSASGPSLPNRFATDEIVVKFRTPAPDANDAIERAAQSVSGGNPPRTREMRPVIQDFSHRQPIWQRLREADPSGLTERQKRLLQRRSRTTASPGGSDLGRIYRIRLHPDSGESLDEVLAAYRSRPDVEYAEANPVISICATPNDRQYANQWALQKIHAPEAWDTCRGSSEVIVAVIDTGVDCNHPDLQGNLWTNGAEQKGRPGVDDDDNGYVDDVHGYNFIYRSGDPTDEQGHGTHCAGIIGAVGNNHTDIAGVCWSARIMALRIFGADGEGTAADAVPAIYYAVANGADVISCSWGGPDVSNALRDAIAYAHEEGVVVVAAAGNNDSDVPFYPAAYPNVISVAATESDDDRRQPSNYGAWVVIAAPGSDILSLRAMLPVETIRGETVTSMSGTSMAAAYVSGACALLLAANPLLRCDEVRSILTTTADHISSGICSSNGRLNLYDALRAAIPAAGMIRMDRSDYAAGADIRLLVADWHLRGAGSRTVSVETPSGDKETVTVRETEVSQGVLLGSIASRNAPVKPGDGVLEVQDGESILARYLDANDGAGHVNQWRQASAVADYTPASLVSFEVTPHRATMAIEFHTSEPTHAEVRYAKTAGGPFDLVAKDSGLSEQHSIELQGLTPQTPYYFVVVTTDEAGNEAVADDKGKGYSFLAQNTVGQFRVPSVYATIQAAIDAAWHGDTVWIADGTYSGAGNRDLDLQGKAITVRSENGPAACIIDCRGQGSGFHIHYGETATSVLDGLTITNGSEVTGAGVQCTSSSPTIRNCVFLKNSANLYGGALCNSYGSHPLVSHCTFRENSCAPSNNSGRGGAVANRYGSSPTLSDCTFIGNSTAYMGGALDSFKASHPRLTGCAFLNNSAPNSGGAVVNGDGCQPIFTQCTFTGNQAGRDGGAMFNMVGSVPVLENCIFNGNRANNYGGAISSQGATVTMMNCTLSGNQALYRCGGVWSDMNSLVQLDSSILWGNTDVVSEGHPDRAQVIAYHSEVQVQYCCVQGWTQAPSDAGNLALDPLFVDAAHGDFHLKSKGWRWDSQRDTWTRDSVTSPCIDAGDPGSPLGNEPVHAPDGSSGLVVVNKRIDMGAYGGTSEASIAPLK
jgi:predicted outer membrane repeat protein